jgi:hypothetical protein
LECLVFQHDGHGPGHRHPRAHGFATALLTSPGYIAGNCLASSFRAFALPARVKPGRDAERSSIVADRKRRDWRGAAKTAAGIFLGGG